MGNCPVVLVIALISPLVCPGAETEDSQAPQQQQQDQAAPQQNQPDPPRDSATSKHAFVKAFLNDEAYIWSSPFRGRSYSSRAFSKYVLPFTLVTGALIATDQRTSEVLPNTRDQAIWSRRVSQVGASYTLAGIGATMYLIGKGTGNKKARETGILGIEAIAHSQIVTQVLKAATQRTRPLDSKENGTGGTAFWRGGDSFPSGHASGSFALATIFAYEYGHDHPWVPYASYGLASIVAASRASGQKHWVSDLFVGSTIGFLIGRHVFKTHHDPQVDGEVRKKASRSIPFLGITAHGGTVAWNW